VPAFIVTFAPLRALAQSWLLLFTAFLRDLARRSFWWWVSLRWYLI
jgi:hypothetical protein